MRAHELEKGSIFSRDGGENWFIVTTEPKEDDNEIISFVARPVDYGSAIDFHLSVHEFVWEPNEDDVSKGVKHFRVKEES